ncbi:MAG: 50S ribosomal protein L16 [Nanoarchaeota archaeon]
MGLRKALSYSKKYARPYTRNSRRKDKSYIKTIPPSKIVKFNTGNQKEYEQGKHTYSVKLIAGEWAQIRDNALEACRMLLTKKLDEQATGQYFMSVKVHPHHFLRENKSAAAVAGADRISTGMTQSFGVVIGRAALVRSGNEILFVSCADEKTAHIAKSVLNMVKSKVPCKTRILFEKLA